MFITRRTLLPDEGGESTTGDGPDAGGGGGGAPSPADMPGADTGITQDDEPSRDDEGDEGVTDWRAKYEEALKHSRKWEDRAKSNRSAQDQLDAIVQAINPDSSGDGKPDIEALTSELSTAHDNAQQAQSELAVYKAAAQSGADPDALLDSRRFMARISDLDPTADDYADQITQAVTDAAMAHPKPARTGKSGNELGASEPTRELDPSKLAAAAHRGGNGIKIF